LRRRYAGISADEQLFQLFPDFVVELRAVEEAGDVAEPALPRALEGLFGLLVGLFGALEDAEQVQPPLARGILSAGAAAVKPKRRSNEAATCRRAVRLRA
jgi:hypothetical protein